MKKIKFAALGMCLVLVLGCSTKTGTGALIGTGGGAALGAVVGAIAGNTGVGTVIGAAVGAGAGALIGNHMDKVAQEAESQIENATVEEITDDNGLAAVKITFDAGLLFKTGDATLSSASLEDLASFATILKENSMCSVDIQGYTDNVGWKNCTAEESQQKNIELSQKRADAVKKNLLSNGVVSTQLVNVEGYGEENPVASNDTEEGRQQNRRVEIYLYASEAMINAANNGQL